MRRREFITLLGGAAAVWPLAARAQQPAMRVIGYFTSQPLETEERRRAFAQGLKDSGYVEGENVTIDHHFVGYQMDRLPALVAELERRRVAVIVTTSGPITAVAAKLTKSIPIVFMVPEDPVGLGLVTSLARPGGNLTGINFFTGELAAKRLELLHELVPTATRVAVLIDPANPDYAETTVRDVEAAASAIRILRMRVDIEAHPISAPPERRRSGCRGAGLRSPWRSTGPR